MGFQYLEKNAVPDKCHHWFIKNALLSGMLASHLIFHKLISEAQIHVGQGAQ